MADRSTVPELHIYQVVLSWTLWPSPAVTVQFTIQSTNYELNEQTTVCEREQ